jgi:hypothetical protein
MTGVPEPPDGARRSSAQPPAYQTEAWIGGRSAALDGPTRTLDRLNRGRPGRGRVASTAAADAPISTGSPDADPGVADPTVAPPPAATPTATDRTGSPPTATNAP